MADSLDPDHARHFVGHDLGPNCFQRLSVDDTSFNGKELTITLKPLITTVADSKIATSYSGFSANKA